MYDPEISYWKFGIYKIKNGLLRVVFNPVMDPGGKHAGCRFNVTTKLLKGDSKFFLTGINYDEVFLYSFLFLSYIPCDIFALFLVDTLYNAISTGNMLKFYSCIGF